MEVHIKPIFALFIGWWIAVNFFALLANNRIDLRPDRAYEWINPEYTHQIIQENLTNLHSKWDSYWYLDIINHGYKYLGTTQPSNIVFFPLYPFLVSLFSIISQNVILTGWIVSSFFGLLSCLYLYEYTRKFHPESNPFTAVYLLLIFPTAYFLNAIYTESLFLFLSIATLYHYKNKQISLSLFLGFLASLTRITGALLLIPLALELGKEIKWKFKSAKWLQLLIVPLGTLCFFGYHYIKFGDPLLFIKVEKTWNRSLFTITTSHFNLTNNLAIANLSLDIIMLTICFIGSILMWKKKQYSYLLYTVANIFLATSGGTLMSIGRYILVIFPIYIVGASIKNLLISHIWPLISILLLGLNILLFVNHYWAG